MLKIISYDWLGDSIHKKSLLNKHQYLMSPKIEPQKDTRKERAVREETVEESEKANVFKKSKHLMSVDTIW